MSDAYHTLTVKEILQRPLFRKAKVVAGHQGLGRIVKWVHAIEVTQIRERDLLHGHELVLSTGIVWGREDVRLSFLKQLIDKNVSALGIQLGYYFEEIPQDLIDMANQHHFPIIIWEKADEVPYVDVTHDLHRALINKHYEMIDQLERFSREVNQLLLSTDALPKILQLLYRYLRMPVVYRTVQGETICLPPPATEEKKEKMVALLQQSRDCAPGVSVAVKSVQAFNQKWAELAIISSEHELSEFESLLLDRCVTALAQELMRRLYVEEKRRQQEGQWLFDWLNGQHDREQVIQQLKSIEPALKSLDFHSFRGTVCIAGFKKQKPAFFSSSYESKLLHVAFIARSIFEQHGWIALSTARDGALIFVLIDKRQSNCWKTRIRKAMERVKQTAEKEEIDFPLTSFGVGQMVEDVMGIPQSFRDAQQVLAMSERLGQPMGPLYEDLYIYRLMHALSKDELRRFVRDYLQPVIDYDRQKGGELLQTLATYLACRGSKQETAEKLFVVRQTLYHRLQKLEELLGSDFMAPEKRLALEFAVHAYQYLGNE